LASEKDTSVPRILGALNLTKKQAKGVLDRLRPSALAPSAHLSEYRWSEDIRGPMLVLPLRLDRGYATAIVLGFPPTTRPEPKAVEQARFIADQTALALENAFRYEAARNLALIDDLTGLYNLRFIETFLDKEFKRAIRQHYPISFLFLDLDHFKPVNDRFGHLVGSRLLVRVARELKDLVRDSDILIRYGGDEYVVILINTLTDGARQVAERIRKSLSTQDFLAEMEVSRSGDLKISASIGIATFPQHGQDRVTVLNKADQAMYRVKSGSRNAVCVADLPA
jgi:diguanylate cyclase (GGDEF)-like protein